MENISDLEHLISIRIMQEDCEAIYSLMASERDPIFASEIIPYYSLFVQAIQEFMGENFLPLETAQTIKDIRNHIKSYSNSFGKTKREISAIDYEEDEKFRSQIRFNSLKNWNIHFNLGTYWTECHHIVGNTQQLAAFSGMKDYFNQETEKTRRSLSYQIGSFVTSVRDGFAEIMIPPVIERPITQTEIKYYHDFNTNVQDNFFATSMPKELQLFFLNLLCNMNFIKYILRSLFSGGNTWLFRIEYVVTYYTLRALQRLSNHSENNADMSIDMQKINEILNNKDIIFQSKFRNCMMHYNLQGKNMLSVEYIEKPFFGIVETCFDGMNFETCLDSLHKVSDTIIAFLEEQFNCASVELLLL